MSPRSRSEGDEPYIFRNSRSTLFHSMGPRYAVRLGSDGFEIDVQLSSDGIPVVIHDHLLDRTTDRTGPVSAG